MVQGVAGSSPVFHPIFPDVKAPLDFLLGNLSGEKPPLPFEKFMEAALYHPDFGYYTTEIQEIGRHGDFSTSATLHTILGESIAQWLQNLPPLPVIEIGAGNGALAETLLRHHEGPYHIVETSKPLQSLQQERLGNAASWHNTLQTALDANQGKAHLVSNELVDAFPCQLLEFNGQQWQEVALEIQNENLSETTIPFNPSSHLPLPPSPQKSQRIEIHRTYHQWLRTWNPHWQQGHSLTIDYGDTLENLYYRRPGGTLRAYLGQQRITGPKIYHHMGQQDLTADVNFTHLQLWAQQLGWKTQPLQTQRQFIQSHLPNLPDDPAAQFLLHPEGAGEAFKVLICEKEVPRA